MQRLSTIELFKEDMKFSAGHFAVFSAEVRENIHGHNYNVYASFTTLIDDEGLSFDYRFYKNKVRKICDSLNEITLIPGKCKYIDISEKDGYFHIKFNNEVMMFLERDIKILPLYNITVEELSFWLLNQILVDDEELKTNKIQNIEVKVFSGPGQSGSAIWSK